MAISAKIKGLAEQGSAIRRMFEAGIALKAQHGEDKVFDLSLGNPVADPPGKFRDVLRNLAQEPIPGMHRYMPNAGYNETREAVAQGLSSETGIPFSMNDVVMTSGAAAALNVVIKTLLDPGDEVVFFAPYFVEYRYYTDNHGGVQVVAPTDEAFQPDLDALEQLITPRTKVVLINSPNNPSGAVYSLERIAALASLLQRKSSQYRTEIFLVSDEPYRQLIYDGLSYPHVFPHYSPSIAVHSHAKDLALPGERIGHIAVNPAYADKQELVTGLIFCNRILGFVNAPALMQHAVRELQGIMVDVADYQRKRDYMYGELTKIGYSCFKPEGAFYLFPKSPVKDDAAFVEELLAWNVLVVPGRTFGSPGFFRISYCVEDRVLEGSIEGFARAAEKCGL